MIICSYSDSKGSNYINSNENVCGGDGSHNKDGGGKEGGNGVGDGSLVI